jgi:raffinose/stachyose/melibiose transport system substrate-binding protein
MAPQQLVCNKVGKHIYAYSTALSFFAVHYNADLFKQLGLTPAKTWPQFLDLCKKLTAAGKVPVAWPPGDGSRDINLPFVLVANDVYAKDPTWNVKRAHGGATFATSGWRTSLQRIVDMRNNGCFSPGVAGTTSDGAIAQFASGQAAMLFLGTHSFSLFPPTLHLGLFPGPPDKVGDPVSVMANQTNFLAVNAATTGAKRDAALKFIDFVARPKQSATFNRAVGVEVTGFDMVSGKLPVDQFPLLKPLAPYITSHSPTAPVYVWPNPLVASALSKGLAGLMTGQKTVDQILADMDAAYNQGRIS